jgi:hypothetical protein
MGNQKASSAAPLALLASPASVALVDQASDQPRDFHFAVTWVTLFAHLDLIESTGPRPRPAASPVLDLIPLDHAPVVSPPVVDSMPRDSSTGWEMVVPRMIRTGRGEFTPAEKSKTDHGRTNL